VLATFLIDHDDDQPNEDDDQDYPGEKIGEEAANGHGHVSLIQLLWGH
jgi:hypothetical protein